MGRKKKYHSPEEKKKSRAATYARARHALLELLGGACCKCGFDDWRALQVDHVHGGGVVELRSMSWADYFEQVRAHPELYQLLCANCNWIKRIEHGENRKVKITVQSVPLASDFLEFDFG